MRAKVIQIPVNRENAIRRQIEVLNGIFKLTTQEMDVLEALIKADPINPATTKARKDIMVQLNFKNTPSLNNIIRTLKLKGAIAVKDPSGYQYHKLLPTSGVLKAFVFKFYEVK